MQTSSAEWSSLIRKPQTPMAQSNDPITSEAIFDTDVSRQLTHDKICCKLQQIADPCRRILQLPATTCHTAAQTPCIGAAFLICHRIAMAKPDRRQSETGSSSFNKQRERHKEWWTCSWFPCGITRGGKCVWMIICAEDLLLTVNEGRKSNKGWQVKA